MCKQVDESQDECLDLAIQIELLTAEQKIIIIKFIENSLLSQEREPGFDAVQ